MNKDGKTHNSETLNDLVKATRDGKEFYEHAATRVDDTELRSLFTRMASEKGEILAGLGAELRVEGDEPATNGSFAGEMNKLYGQARASLGDEKYAYVAQLEHSEDRLLKAFNEAMADEDVTPRARALIERYLPTVRQSHDVMSSRKHALKKAA